MRSPFDQAERRIPGDALVGLGLALVHLRPLKPVIACVISLLAWLYVRRESAGRPQQEQDESSRAETRHDGWNSATP